MLAGMACAAEGRDVVRRCDAIRRRCADRGAVLHAGSVAGVAAQSFFEMRVGLEIGDLLGVAGRAKFVSFLGKEREGEQEQHCPHMRRASLRLIAARLGTPASAMSSFSSAAIIPRI